MKQETGSNRLVRTNRELSIQITLSGFSFFVSQDGKVLYGSETVSYDFETIVGDPSKYGSIFVGWNSDTVQLLPQTVFDAGHAEEYVKAMNMSDPSTSVIYNDTLDKEIAAVWTVDSEVLNSIEELMPDAYHYHNLQIDVMNSQPETVRISILENKANVVLEMQNGLHAAETVSFESAEDLLFFVAKLNAVDKFGRNSLELIAPDAEMFRGLFGRHFSKCRFIQNENIYHSIMLKCE